MIGLCISQFQKHTSNSVKTARVLPKVWIINVGPVCCLMNDPFHESILESQSVY